MIEEKVTCYKQMRNYPVLTVATLSAYSLPLFSLSLTICVESLFIENRGTRYTKILVVIFTGIEIIEVAAILFLIIN